MGRATPHASKDRLAAFELGGSARALQSDGCVWCLNGRNRAHLHGGVMTYPVGHLSAFRAGQTPDSRLKSVTDDPDRRMVGLANRQSANRHQFGLTLEGFHLQIVKILRVNGHE